MKHVTASRALWKRSAIALSASLCLCTMALAQSSDGSLFGRAKAGTSVSITNVETGSTRQSKVESDGSFAFSKLPPGRYRVTAGGQTREVSVAIGSGTEVVMDDTQRIEISGSRARTLIDVSSVESNSVFTQDQIRNLPVARNIDAVALLAPGTVKGDKFGDAENPLSLPSFGGASIAENGYYINGFDVTNIRNFLAYANLPFEAVAQQQVKTGGYGAEFGRSLGGVVSLVTKRGTNDWKGGVSLTLEPKSLRGKGRNVADNDPDRVGKYTVFEEADTRDVTLATVYGGGPIIKDKLFIFGALEVPDDRWVNFGQNRTTEIRNTQPQGLIKIDFMPNDRNLLELTAIENKRKRKVSDWTNPTTPVDMSYATTKLGSAAGSTINGGGSVYIGKYTGYFTDALTVSATAGRVEDLVDKTSGARAAGLDCPVVFNVGATQELGCWQGPFPGVGDKDQKAPRDRDLREAWRVDLEYVLSPAHTIKAGYDAQTFKSSEAGGSTYTGGIYWRYFVAGATGAVNGVTGAVAPGGNFVRGRVVQSTSGVYEVENNAIYVEDTWKATKNLTLYGGLRWESFNNKNGDGVSFVKADNLLAPRTGFSWNVNGDSSLKVYGNAGRYYIPVASNTNIRGTRGELFVTNFYVYNGLDARTAAPQNLGPAIGTPQVNSDGSLPDPSTIADTKLKPMSQDELILGFQKALSKDWVVGAKVVHRKINDGMDDFCGHYPFINWAADNGFTNFDKSALAGCILMNPGRDATIKMDLQGDGKLTAATVPARYFNLAQYKRTYDALELSLEKPFNGNWGMQASYTYSKSKGTAEGYVQSNLNQDDAGVTQDFDFGSFSDGSDGYLPNDRRHVIKVFGNYALTKEWRLGMNTTLASGRPLSCIGYVPTTVPDYFAGDPHGSSGYSSASSYYCLQSTTEGSKLVKRGSVGRTGWTNTIDLQVSYVPDWASGKLTLQADVFNIFNNRKATELNETRDYSRDTSLTAPYRLNQNYLTPTSFQESRYVRLTARYEF